MALKSARRFARLSEIRVTFRLVSEQSEHASGIERVLGRAFGPGRFAKSSERVRERGAVLDRNLSRIAVNESGEVIGVCRISHVSAGEASFCFLGPLAVDPAAQGGGLGFALAKDCVAAVRAAAGGGIVLVGAEAFFRPLGFTQIPAARLSMPGPFVPQRFLWLELRPGAFDRAHGEIGAPR